MRAATFAARDAISTGSRPICIERAPRLLGRRRGDARDRTGALSHGAPSMSNVDPAFKRQPRIESRWRGKPRGAGHAAVRGANRTAAPPRRETRKEKNRGAPRPSPGRSFCGTFAALLRLFLRLSSRLSRLLPHHVGPPLDRMPAARARVELRGIAPPNRLRAGRD
ncbi:hypothetical protein AQ938_18040 [Burkholderia pseudomallei]|nr:hypothetical protein PTBPS01_17800 [Burkholderia pseudomallei]OMT78786.1 hypothetical protein AQ764_25270 [Burkholderia pseudomallei]ONA19393.1 hypothetical protein AQ878_06380 [Burkholderia pseudomallei]OND53743.1 hypothetical protein AQ935_23125 [Burkholderia pseudomallei]OND74277.1 hypothetical protein AQ938_18040 [Burkholderia pseudomallei]